MDNPQHYQPLSHALHPPQAQTHSAYTPNVMFNAKVMRVQRNQREEEEEEEEEDGDDEGVVEEQLNRQETDGHASSPSTPQTNATGSTNAQNPQNQMLQTQQDDQNSTERKRRPGRPRGSKNRKPRVSQGASKPESGFQNQNSGVMPPQHPDVNAHNQQYYEFQWRVLNLCAEFYNAAEELVKGTQPLVIAQCYQMGPGSKVDPLVMLGEAKHICDTLLHNPSQLVSSPPPPIYTVTPTLYQPVQTSSATSASTASTRSAATSSKPAAKPTTVISNPGTFVMPLPPTQTTYPHTQYPVYPPPPGQYPTTPYYQYSYVNPGSYYTQPPPAQTLAPLPSTSQASSTTTQPSSTQPEASSSASVTPVITTTANAAGNQGAWSEDETQRLRKLAEDSRSVGQGEIEWGWVVSQWGNSRTRHQILIKATSLGLKASGPRGAKRRREDEGTNDATSAVPPTPTVTTTSSATATPATLHTNIMNPPATTPIPTSASPSLSQTASTPAASPALANQQRPPIAPKPVSNLPWPMPTVAVNTPSPVVTSASSTSVNHDQQRTSYYRARPSQDTTTGTPSTGGGAGVSKSSSAQGTPQQHPTHPFMYQPNGNAGTSRLGKENGK